MYLVPDGWIGNREYTHSVGDWVDPAAEAAQAEQDKAEHARADSRLGKGTTLPLICGLSLVGLYVLWAALF
jgi:hypothetical protein